MNKSWEPEHISLPSWIERLRLASDLADPLLSLILDPGLSQQFTLGVDGGPLVGQLRGASLPGLQVQGGPDDIEEGEEDEADVLQELPLAIKEDPEEETNQGRDTES